jgi:hypothetical protein
MNKNTRQLKAKIAYAVNARVPQIQVEVPVKNYHSEPKKISITLPVPLVGKDGVVSKNLARNMQMVVHRNPGDSRTFHEPINSSQPFRPYKKGPNLWVNPR